jgi:hypothetical protein
MAETVHEETDTIPDAQAYRRAGLTMREAIRRENVQRWRAETQSPWEAGLFGLAAWILWRAVFKGFQPLWLIASLALAAWYGLSWMMSAGGVEAMTEAEPEPAERVRAAVAASVPPGIDARLFWNAQLGAALDGDHRRRPDIDLFRSWAALGPDLVGRDRLALERLAGPSGAVALDARLRAGPPQERRQRLDRTLQEALQSGRAAGLVPPELVFAEPRVRDRYARSQFAWSVAQTSAEGFFRGARQGEFEMRSLSGLVSPHVTGPTRIYGGVRHLMMQACAQSVAGLTGCESEIIPHQGPDDLQYALAAMEAGAVQLHIPSSAVRAGAETLQAARLAGRLDPDFEAWLRVVLADAVPAARISDALQDSAVRADLAFAAPDRAALSLYHRIDQRTASQAVTLSQLLQDLSLLRDATSPVVAIRLLDGVRSLEDLQHTAWLSRHLGPGTLAARLHVSREALFRLEAGSGPGLSNPQLEQRTMLALISAALVLLLTLIRVVTPRRIRLASRTNLADAWISRLTLGRKT